MIVFFFNCASFSVIHFSKREKNKESISILFIVNQDRLITNVLYSRFRMRISSGTILLQYPRQCIALLSNRFFFFFFLVNPSIESRARIAAACNVSYFGSCTRTNLGCMREGPNVRFESDKSEL